MTLREITPVRQDHPAQLKRWFEDQYFDLVVWYERPEATGPASAVAERPGSGARGEPPGPPIAFQLCYGKPCAEHALSWHHVTGYTHHAIDDGERTGSHKRAPLLVADGAFLLDAVLARFDQAAQHLAPDLRAFVRERLAGYGRSSI